MWCENCNKQFEDDVTVCPECGSKLVEYTPILSEDTDLFGINEEYDDVIDENEEQEAQLEIETVPQLLVTVIGEKEAKRIIAFLDENRIPAFEKISDEQFPEELENIYWDEENTDDVDEEDLIVEEVTPPEVEQTEISGDTALYDIFVPEDIFPEAMALILENDQDNDTTLIEDIEEIAMNTENDEIYEDSEIEQDDQSNQETDDSLEVQEYDETESMDEVNDNKEKSKGGFWGLFKK